MDTRLRILVLLLSLAGASWSQHGVVNSLPFLEEEKLTLQKLELLGQVNTMIDLNKSDSLELLNSGLFSPSQVTSLLGYRAQNGDLLSVHELQVIDGFEIKQIITMLDYIHVGTPGTGLSEKKGFLLWRTERTIEVDRGSFDGVFVGSPFRLMTRVAISSGKGTSYGLLLEKDKGESLRWQPGKNIYGPDFYSGHVAVQNKGILDKLIIGDYTFQSGEGLILGAGLNLGKNYEAILSLKKAFSGLKPYTSSGESGFFRGLAATISLSKKLKITLIGSSTLQDAVLYEDANFGEFFKSIQNSGLHRADNELRNRKTVRESLAAMNMDHSFQRTQWGFNIVLSKWNRPIEHKSAFGLHTLHEPAMDAMSSVYLNKTWKNFHFFSEYGMNSSAVMGGLSGLMLNLTKSTEVGTVYRNYAANFDNRYGGAFGEYYKNSNERGSYYGISHRFNSCIRVSAYLDSFRFPWLKNGVSSPSTGNEALVHGEFKFRSGSSINMRWRKDTREITLSGNEIGMQRKTNYQISISHPLINNWELKSRIQGSTFEKMGLISTGMLMSIELTSRFRNFSISNRVILFDTDDYANRQYIYEKDLQYSFSLPAFQGNGFRWYSNMKFSINRRIMMWLRWSRTVYLDRSEIGSGSSAIQGNSKTEIKFQLRYQIFGSRVP